MPAAQQQSPEHVTIAVDKEGNFSWNGEPVSCEELERRLNDLPRKTEVAPAPHFPCSEIDKVKTGH
jgi:biopolymer transport protein ExbD